MQIQRTNSTSSQRNKRTSTNIRSHKQSALYNFEGYQRPASNSIPSKRSQHNRVQTALTIPKSAATNANGSGQQPPRRSNIGITSASIMLRQKRNTSDSAARLAGAKINNQIISIDDSSQEADDVFPDVDDILGTPSKATNERRSARPLLKRAERSLNVISSEDEGNEPPVERRSKSHRHNSKRSRKRDNSSQSDEVKLISDIQLPSTPQPAPLETATTLRSPPATLPRAKEKAAARQNSALFSTQDTLVGASLGSRNNTATRNESIRDLSPTLYQAKRKQSAESAVPRRVDAELSDDPIGEFVSQKPLPPATPTPTPTTTTTTRKKKQVTLVSSDPIESSTGESGQHNSNISQRYHDCHDDYIGVKDDSRIDVNGEQLPQRHDEEAHVTMFLDNVDYEFRQESQLGSHRMSSSPLEGFCDVRNITAADSGDTAIYMNQFIYGNSQPSRRGRAATPTTVQMNNAAAGGGGGDGGGIRPAGSREMLRSLAKRHSPSSLSKDNTVHTNHYADEGNLDIAPSMNWEGQGGCSRFG